jgi:hypothetical protein
MKDGLHNYVIELRGVNDRMNDPEIEVGFHSTDDKSLLSAAGDHLPNQSFAVTKNPRWRNILRGRIENGVIRTETVDALTLNWFSALNGPFGAANEYPFRSAQLKLELRPDGTLKGILGGYLPVDTTTAQARNGGKGVATNGNRNCASEYKSMLAYADGFPDPRTGQCTMISLAQGVVAIPPFVLHPETDPARTAALSP